MLAFLWHNRAIIYHTEPGVCCIVLLAKKSPCGIMELSHNQKPQGGIFLMQDYNNTVVDLSQPLKDHRRNGKPQPWQQHKEQSVMMSYAYDQLGNDSKARRVLTCAPRLLFDRAEDGRLRLQSATFCRVRLCPVCQWRRSLKLYGQTTEVVRAVQAQGACAWVMLTLTVRNVDGPDLPEAISCIHAAWHRLVRTKAFAAAVLGWQRCLEVTHNIDVDSTAYNTYHPHIHALLCVRPSYFTSRAYISKAKWADMWAAAARLDYTPQVWVTKVKGDAAAAIAEVTKYAAKPADYLTPWDIDLMLDSVAVMDKALHKRRLVAFGGLLKQAHQALGLDDIEDGDLVHTDTDPDTATAAAALAAYAWVPGYRQYYKER